MEERWQDAVLHKQICSFNATPILTPTGFLGTNWQTNEFAWKCKESRTSKEILPQKENKVGLRMRDFKTYSKATAIKTRWYGVRVNTYMNSTEGDAHYVVIWFSTRAKETYGERKLSTEGTRSTRYTYHKVCKNSSKRDHIVHFNAWNNDTCRRKQNSFMTWG